MFEQNAVFSKIEHDWHSTVTFETHISQIKCQKRDICNNFNFKLSISFLTGEDKLFSLMSYELKLNHTLLITWCYGNNSCFCTWTWMIENWQTELEYFWNLKTPDHQESLCHNAPTEKLRLIIRSLWSPKRSLNDWQRKMILAYYIYILFDEWLMERMGS